MKHIHLHFHDAGTSEGAKKAALTRKQHGGGALSGALSGKGTPSKKTDLQRRLRQAGIRHHDTTIMDHNGNERNGTHVDHREHMNSHQDALMHKLIKEHGDHALYGDKGITFAHSD